jgi:signal transduction histidine kinase
LHGGGSSELRHVTSVDRTVGMDSPYPVEVPNERGLAPTSSALELVRDALAVTLSARNGQHLDEALERSERALAGAGGGPAASRVAALSYATDALVLLAAEGELTPEDVQATAEAISRALELDPAAARFLLFSRVVASPLLLELPPLSAAGVQLRLLLDLGLFDDLSLWRRTSTGQAECVLRLGNGEIDRRVRAEARAALRGRSGLRLVGRSAMRSAPVLRFQQAVGAVVGHVTVDDRQGATAFLREAALALGPVLERELLLERSRARERALVASAERKLMRLGFDLHDGPIQDVLALGADLRLLQQQLYPFVLDSHRELAYGRFEDVSARVAEIDRTLREIAHSLESKSIVSRPLGEVLHREVDTFAERSGIDAQLEFRGDPDSLSSSQRVTVFRALQEALANVREHSGATTVEIRIRARRTSIDVRVTDDGAGFEVGRALARAAKRGRLGVVGIGERVRMLGGTFELDSRPGGPTTLAFTLPRVQPDDLR